MSPLTSELWVHNSVLATTYRQLAVILVGTKCTQAQCLLQYLTKSYTVPSFLPLIVPQICVSSFLEDLRRGLGLCALALCTILELQRNLHRSSITNTPYRKRGICPEHYEVFHKKKKGYFTHLPIWSKCGKITLKDI